MLLTEGPGECVFLGTGEALREDAELFATPCVAGVGVMDRSELSIEEGFRSLLLREDWSEVLLSVRSRGG